MLFEAIGVDVIEVVMAIEVVIDIEVVSSGMPVVDAFFAGPRLTVFDDVDTLTPALASGTPMDSKALLTAGSFVCNFFFRLEPTAIGDALLSPIFSAVYTIVSELLSAEIEAVIEDFMVSGTNSALSKSAFAMSICPIALLLRLTSLKTTVVVCTVPAGIAKRRNRRSLEADATPYGSSHLEETLMSEP